MIRTALHLFPKEGCGDALLKVFAERRVLSRAAAIPGCISIEVQTLLPNSEEVLVTALWRSERDYQTWLQCDGRAEDAVLMAALLRNPADLAHAAKLYRVEHHTSRREDHGMILPG